MMLLVPINARAIGKTFIFDSKISWSSYCKGDPIELSESQRIINYAPYNCLTELRDGFEDESYVIHDYKGGSVLRNANLGDRLCIRDRYRYYNRARRRWIYTNVDMKCGTIVNSRISINAPNALFGIDKSIGDAHIVTCLGSNRKIVSIDWD